MKKVTFLAAAIALLGLTSLDASAQTSTPQNAAQQTQAAQTGQQGQEVKKEKVTQDQLPAAVQTALKSDTYKDWTVSEINKVAPAAGQTKAVYEITLTNAEGQKGIVKMNEDGGDASKE